MLVMAGLCVLTVVTSGRATQACVMQQHIPYWNIVTCVILLLIIINQILQDIGVIDWCSGNCVTIFMEKLDKNRRKELKIFKDHGRGFIYVALFIWFIPGTAWIFTNIDHFVNGFIKRKEKFDCDAATYVLGALIIIIAFMFAMVKCIIKFIHSRSKWEDRMSGPKTTNNPLPDKYRVKIPIEEPIELHSDGSRDGIEIM